MSTDSAGLPRLIGILKPLLQTILIAIIIAGCIWCGALTQQISGRYLIYAMLIIVAWVAYALLFGIGIHSSLPLIAIVFFKPMEITFYLVLGFLLMMGFIEFLRRNELKLAIPYPMAGTLLLAFGILSAIKINTSMGYTYFFSTVITPLIILIIFANLRLELNSMYVWMQSIVYVAAVVGLYGIIIAIQNPLERLGSFWFTAMTINGFYIVSFFFAVSLVLYHTNLTKKLINAMAALLILFGMLYTYTRIVILAVAFGVFLLMLRLKTMRYVGIGFMLLLPLIIPSSMESRIELGFNMDVSLIIRALAWYNSLILIFKHPLTGIGFSVWSTWYPSVIPLQTLFAQHTHNVYLNLIVEMGIVGAASFLYLVWKIMRRFWQSCISHTGSILHFGMWVAMMAILFSCLTDIFIQQYSISILFWISLGLMQSLSSKEKHRAHI
ncbi:MAG: O-antigen ligase family protein [Candidatus Cloacimonetes bacterium]|nr:O-antigen ligase family protein [Candidatus Cloacimonadota bacterium]MDD4231280.1 O-antigen ligase family protein [Candidatus Cloacimonadota bacterium]